MINDKLFITSLHIRKTIVNFWVVGKYLDIFT